ncbi:Norsolorinic acid ketoreductase [Cladorrhinum sp. PSN259]|nr:Norsolorinic acid ketoreductase [Cladorrhinum sp. PSN259]
MAENNTVYLVTGANRGIGLSLTTNLLTRPNTTVIATSRSPFTTPTTSPHTTPPHPSSTLIPILLDESNPQISSSTLLSRLSSLGIAHIDVLIANAGSSVGFKTLAETKVDDIVADLEVNLLNVVKLFNVTRPLLLETRQSKQGKQEEEKEITKLIVVSSSVGSIGLLSGEEGNLPVGSYGLSKAALNWWAQKVAVEYKEKGLMVGVIHPGWVKTGMGQGLADAVGLKEPPSTTEESARGVLEQIDNLTWEKTNQFLMYDGRVLPW